jgi:ribosome-associated protein
LLYWNRRQGGGPIEPRAKALSIAEIASEHKALDLRILEVLHHCDYADYFVLMSAQSTRHARALADAVLENASSGKVPEGYALGEWVLVDLGDVVVHIFHEPQRMYYNFDRLWGHVPSHQPDELRAPARPVKSQSRPHA